MIQNFQQHFHLKTARTLARLLDNQFSFLGIRFGLDGILGLIPGIGDIISMVLSGYLIWIATELKLPQQKIWQMARNVALDLLIGSIPLIGDVSDVFLRVNLKNLAILETYVKLAQKTNAVLEGEVI